jgi:hypothetical protein
MAVENMQQQDTFLFTSESVGEGHPGTIMSVIQPVFMSIPFFRIFYFFVISCHRMRMGKGAYDAMT